MKIITFAITLIGTGVAMGFTLIVYAHGNFATKEMVRSAKQDQFVHQQLIRDDVTEMKTDIKEILKRSHKH